VRRETSRQGAGRRHGQASGRVRRSSDAETRRLPGRPSGASGDKTRARIIANAVEVFARDGLAGASVRDIARRARIRVSTLYHYFPSKESLYEEVQDRVQAQIRELTLSVLSRSTDLGEAAREVIGRLFDFFLAHRAYVRLAYRVGLEGGPWLESERRIADRWIGLTEGMLGPAAARGDVRPVDPILFVLTVEALLQWHVVNDAVYRQLLGQGLSDPEVRRRVREHVIEVCLRALGLS
jgi:TetR/AcrR family transcriptional regulator